MRRVTAGITTVVAAVAIASPGAIAATPKEIYSDYADNGRLDRAYTPTELQRALKDAVLQGYGGPKKDGLVPKVKRKIGEEKRKPDGKLPEVSVPPVRKDRGPLPFTGLDLALIGLGGASLLAFGAGLRRFARRSR